MLSAADLEAFIQRNEIKADLIRLKTSTPTVESAAQAMRTSPGQILKSVLFLVRDHPVLVIGIGPARIDRRPIASHYGVGKKKVILADPETVLEITGYPVGTIPPFGHRTKLETLLDVEILRMESVFAGGGAIDTMMCVSTKDLLRTTSAQVLPLQVQRPTDGLTQPAFPETS